MQRSDKAWQGKFTVYLRGFENVVPSAEPDKAKKRTRSEGDEDDAVAAAKRAKAEADHAKAEDAMVVSGLMFQLKHKPAAVEVGEDLDESFGFDAGDEDLH